MIHQSVEKTFAWASRHQRARNVSRRFFFRWAWQRCTDRKYSVTSSSPEFTLSISTRLAHSDSMNENHDACLSRALDFARRRVMQLRYCATIRNDTSSGISVPNIAQHCVAKSSSQPVFRNASQSFANSRNSLLFFAVVNIFWTLKSTIICQCIYIRDNTFSFNILQLFHSS